MNAPLKVFPLGMDAEFGFVVRGTSDVDLARAAVRDHRRQHPIDEDYEAGTRGMTDADLVGQPDTLERASEELAVRRTGLFRWNPCNRHFCGEQHNGHLIEADERGRGVWPGVWLERAFAAAV